MRQILDTIKPFTLSPGAQGNIGFSGLGPLNHVVYIQDDLGCLDKYFYYKSFR